MAKHLKVLHNSQLTKYMQDNEDAHRGLSAQKVAVLATEALGFPVNGDHVNYRRQQLEPTGFTWRVERKPKVKAKQPTVSPSAVRTLARLVLRMAMHRDELRLISRPEQDELLELAGQPRLPDQLGLLSTEFFDDLDATPEPSTWVESMRQAAGKRA